MARLLSLAVLASALATPLFAQGTPETAARSSAEPLFIHALASLYVGDPARAVTRLSDVLLIYPEDPVVLDVLAEAYLAQGLAAEALYHAEQAVALAPDDASIQRRYAEVLSASGDAVRAQQARDAADLLDPRPPPPQAAPSPPSPARPAVAPGSELPGEAAFREARYAEAAEALLRVVDETPRQIDAWPLLLDALTRAEDARAGETAELAVLLYPTVASILVPAAEALHSAGRSDAAAAAATSALRALDAGTDAPALRQRADALLSSLR